MNIVFSCYKSRFNEQNCNSNWWLWKEIFINICMYTCLCIYIYICKYIYYSPIKLQGHMGHVSKKYNISSFSQFWLGDSCIPAYSETLFGLFQFREAIPNRCRLMNPLAFHEAVWVQSKTNSITNDNDVWYNKNILY